MIDSLIAGGLAAAAALAIIHVLRSNHRAVMAQNQSLHLLLAGSKQSMEALGSDIAELRADLRAWAANEGEKLKSELDQLGDKELLDLAHSLIYVRPLVAYPKWRFDADWENPDFTFVLRKQVWRLLCERGVAADLSIPWHGCASFKVDIRSDAARQLFVGGTIDPNEFAWLDRILEPGMTVLDVGANDGLYTVFSACRCGTVYAFEPSSREFKRLKENVESNSLRHVTLFPVALGEEDGSAQLKLANEEHPGHNTLGQFVYEGVASGVEEPVTVRSLDSLLREHPLDRIDLIKSDTEGSELAFLKGAAATLERFRPVLLVEINHRSLHERGASAAEVANLLGPLGYCLYECDARTGLPIRAVGDPAGWNTNIIAWPEQRSMPARVFRPYPIKA